MFSCHSLPPYAPEEDIIPVNELTFMDKLKEFLVNDPKADHYCHIRSFPAWATDMEDLGTIGRHKFFNSKRHRA